jgi:RNA polymerase sigma-70 factor, ECF subfamily
MGHGAESAAAPAPPRVPEEIVVRFVAGDPEAFERVFECIRGDILGIVRRFFRGAFDQEEAFQEAWLQIHRVRSRFDVNRSGAFLSWARQVARNRCIDLLRVRRNLREVPRDDLDETLEAAPPDRPEPSLDGKLREALDLLLARLDEEERAAFELCFVQELSHEEIAARLGISERRSKYLKKKLLERIARSPLLARLRAGEPP